MSFFVISLKLVSLLYIFLTEIFGPGARLRDYTASRHLVLVDVQRAVPSPEIQVVAFEPDVAFAHTPRYRHLPLAGMLCSHNWQCSQQHFISCEHFITIKRNLARGMPALHLREFRNL